MTTATARVLTAENDPVVRANLRLVLEGAGFSICADARDGIEAVDLAREHKPDLVLLDLGVQRLDGIEATRQILADREVPIVALAGASGERTDAAVNAGATSFVVKTFAPGQLVGAVVDALDLDESPKTTELRAESRATLTTLATALGYPEDWGDVLERRAYATGHVWRVVG
jgi:response regulator NasT